MTRKYLQLTDVSLTDGQTAVWSGAMTTGMMMKVINRLDASRLSAIEVISSATILQCLRRGEDPWQRIELLRGQNTSLPFRANINLLIGNGHPGSDVISSEVAERWVMELAKRGISQIVVLDPLAIPERVAPVYQATSAAGLTPIGVLPFAEDGIQSDNFLGNQAARLVAAGAERLMLRDESGLLTTERAATLIPHLLKMLGGTPLFLHTRCTTALGPLVAIEAIRLGVSELDTTLPSLANGASLPSSTALARSLDVIKANTEDVNQSDTEGPDISVLDDANAILLDIADREGFSEAVPWVFDLAPFVHQLAGDVAAWAMDKLRAQNEWFQLQTFSNECARIRGEIGSPPMLAPFARAVAEQAFLNLGSNQRYKEIRPVIRRAIQGAYGSTGSKVDPSLLRWVGASHDKPLLPWNDVCVQDQLASDEQKIIMQISGLAVESQPAPSAMEDLVYNATCPIEVLIRRLQDCSKRYSQLSVHSGDFSIEYRSTGF